VGLLYLLLLVFLQALLTLVGSQLTVRGTLRQVVSVFASPSSCRWALAALRSISTCIGRLLLISFKHRGVGLFEFWALASINSIFILAVGVLASTKLLHRSQRADRLQISIAHVLEVAYSIIALDAPRSI
jgi:hypothetical protein